MGLTGTFLALLLIGFFARLSYGMARTPLPSVLGALLAEEPRLKYHEK